MPTAPVGLPIFRPISVLLWCQSILSWNASGRTFVWHMRWQSSPTQLRWEVAEMLALGATFCRSVSPRTDCPFIQMHEEVKYKRRLPAMTSPYVHRLGFDNFDASSLLPDIERCCMDCSSNSCWFMSFSSVWLEQLHFEVCLWQVHTDSSPRVILGWHNVAVFAARLFGRAQYNIGIDAINWGLFHGHRYLLSPTTLVLTYYRSPAYDYRYSPLLKEVDLTEFGACWFLRDL